MKTQAGERLRRLMLWVFDQDLQLVRSVVADVKRSRVTFGAAERWADRNNKFASQADARIEALFRQMPKSQQAALMRALREVFGNQVR
jgi:hypothetical protein